jgi:ABC-type amino acid transport substrate-binding protein
MNEPFTPAQTEKLLRIAAAKLGTTPEGLRAAFEQGGLKGLAANLSPQQAQSLQNGQAEKLLQDPAVQRLLIQLLGR